MQREESVLLQQQLQVFNLFSRRGNYNSSKTYEADHPNGSQNGLPCIPRLIDEHKRVPGEKRNRYYFLAVAPPVMFGQKRKEHLEALLIELCGDSFLETVPRLDCKPLLRSARCNRLRRRVCSAAKSFSRTIATAH